MTSIIKVDQIQNTAGGVPTAADLGINTTGSVLQVVSDTVTAPSTISPGTTFTAYPNLAATITPISASSKIYVSAYCTWAANIVNQDIMIRIARNGSGVFIGDARNSNTRATYGQGDAVAKVHFEWGSVIFSTAFLDSPNSTNSQTYTIQFATGFAQGSSIYLGQQGVNSSGSEQNTAPATIVLMEIAG